MTIDPRVEATAAPLGLPTGRLISWSKSGYRELHPHSFVLFNASIVDDAGALLWWGDIDLTYDEAKLSDLARALDQRLHLLLEADGRFIHPIPINLAVAVFEADGRVVVTSRFPVERDAEGQIVRPAHPG
jgi:hypothetical protein